MILGQFAGGPAVRTDYNQTDPSKADYLVGRESIANHLANKDNPHGVTIAQIGAAPLINIGNYNGDINDIEALPVNSVAWITTSTVNNPYSKFGVIETWGSHDTIRNQRINYTDGCVCQRIRYNSKWTDWEFVNPPMALNTEYRTTERFDGKVVYAKRINFGAMPNNTTAYTERDLIPSNATNVQFHGFAKENNTGVYYSLNYPSPYVKCWVNTTPATGYIGITTDDNWSSCTAYFIVKYTKD